MTTTTKMPIQIASAPVSWGVMEETDTSVWPTAAQVLQEIAAAGYDGTELGPYAYYPTEPQQLRATLSRQRLTLTSAFVPLRWFQPERLPAGNLEVDTIDRAYHPARAFQPGAPDRKMFRQVADPEQRRLGHCR